MQHCFDYRQILITFLQNYCALRAQANFESNFGKSLSEPTNQHAYEYLPTPASSETDQDELDAIAKHAYPGLETVVFCGVTDQEQKTIRDLVEQGL